MPITAALSHTTLSQPHQPPPQVNSQSMGNTEPDKLHFDASNSLVIIKTIIKQDHMRGSAVVLNISTAVIRSQARGRTTSSVILLLYNSSTSAIY